MEKSQTSTTTVKTAHLPDINPCERRKTSHAAKVWHPPATTHVKERLIKEMQDIPPIALGTSHLLVGIERQTVKKIENRLNYEKETVVVKKCRWNSVENRDNSN